MRPLLHPASPRDALLHTHMYKPVTNPCAYAMHEPMNMHFYNECQARSPST